MNTSNGPNQIEIAWASTPKWATSGTSDLIDVIDRGDGSQALILIDVQGSGPSGGRLARNLMGFARELLVSGSDSAIVANASNQFLFAQRGGGVGASVHLIVTSSSNLELSVTGYGPCQIAHLSGANWLIDEFRGELAGTMPETPPSLSSVTSLLGQSIVIANDGAASNAQELLEMVTAIDSDLAASDCANQVLARAIERDGGRPRSDMAIAAVRRTSSARSDRVDAGSRVFQLRNHRSAP